MINQLIADVSLSVDKSLSGNDNADLFSSTLSSHRETKGRVIE